MVRNENGRSQNKTNRQERQVVVHIRHIKQAFETFKVAYNRDFLKRESVGTNADDMVSSF